LLGLEADFGKENLRLMR